MQQPPDPEAAMPRLPAVVLSLILAATLHVDWHLARPMHHRLSLDWPYHWLATALVFGLVGWFIARTWPASAWRLGAVALIAAVVLAQCIEPILEVAFYESRFGYASEPARWAAFGRAILASVPVYLAALWLCRGVAAGPDPQAVSSR
jgi:hypothetical protein